MAVSGEGTEELVDMARQVNASLHTDLEAAEAEAERLGTLLAEARTLLGVAADQIAAGWTECRVEGLVRAFLERSGED